MNTKIALICVCLIFSFNCLYAQGGGTEGPGGTNCLHGSVDPNGDCCLDSEKDCEGICNGNATADCAGTCGGDAIEDCRGICGGNTQYDCRGICNGDAIEDCNGICEGTSKLDCSGICGGSDLPDCAGTCGGSATLDCAGVCNGSTQPDCLGVCNGGAQLDCAGVCNGAAELDCNGACGGNAEIDVCGTCEGDGSSCGSRCEIYSIFITEIFGGNSENQTLSSEHVFQGTDNVPACFQNAINNFIDDCYSDPEVESGDQDDCVYHKVAQEFNMPGVYRGVGQTFYLDENCNTVKPDGSQVPCDIGTLRYMQSPISLIWDTNFNFETDLEAKIVNFPLAPGSKEYFVWKASGKAPLLVFDPEKTGDIKHATQLFGNHTFGGKAVASISSNQYTQTEWRDGFEALETLDKDKSGKIEGKELKPLSLWFDYNQDGISQKGEVKDLKELGINWINTQSNRINSSSGSVISELGFSRTVNGNEIISKAIDWYGEGASSKAELINHFTDLAYRKNKLNNSNIIEKKEAKKIASIKHVLNGLWKWNTNQKSIPGGYLGLKFINDKEFVGHSYFSSSLTRPVKEISSIGGVSKISGKIISENAKEIKLKLTINGTENESPVLSYLVYDKESKKIIGNTKTKVTLENNSMSVDYSWKASKVK